MDLVDQTKLKLDVECSKQDIGVLKSEIEALRLDRNALFDYCISSDARLLAFQKTLTRILMKDEEKKEAFEAELAQDHKTLYEIMKEELRGKSPQLYEVIYGDKSGR